MSDLKVGDRVSHKRRGCIRDHGTVVAVEESVVDPGEVWVRVKWDHGPVCLWEPRNLKAEKQKVR